MELKDYQQQALETLDRYLDALKDARQQAKELAALDPSTLRPALREQSAAFATAAEDYPRAAWESLRKKSGLPGVIDENGENRIPEYISREAASGDWNFLLHHNSVSATFLLTSPDIQNSFEYVTSL